MNISRNDFIKNVANAAIKHYAKYKILPSMTIAQACKESAFGLYDCAGSFNFFGMKKGNKNCDYVELNTKEWNGREYITVKAKFRKYNSFDEGIEGYYEFITAYTRYKNLVGVKDSLEACKLIQADGWATDPNYGLSLYNDYVLKYNLLQYDLIALGINPAPTETSEVPTGYTEYVVKRGDTLWGISREFLGFGNKYKKIVEYNKLQTTTIYPGQILKIPKGV